ncbi:hypothetical protein PR048_031017 [Dryococelus australis]|uniref:Uncharacterized protein n=1 Tax=Dryococelus australis TaxID=614101 RepID=A0ABQ9G438_9NEOP|nr:hypothetical protein PR048_031017 [Dryococelus australis]
MRVIEVNMERHRNEGAGEAGDPRPGIEPGSPWWEASMLADIIEVEVLRDDEGDLWSSAGMQGRGKREISEKTRQPAVSSCTIPLAKIRE